MAYVNLLSSEFNLTLWYQVCHDETGVIDLSDVIDKPTYAIITSSMLILAKILNFLLLNIHLRRSTYTHKHSQSTI